MHKGVILLTKADDRNDALANIKDFMEDYGEGKVWDWYEVGGRWNNTLAPPDKKKLFVDWVHAEYKHAFTKYGEYRAKHIENENDRAIIQSKWEEFGLKGKNPYYPSHLLTAALDDYNVIKLEDCLEAVRDWTRDVQSEKEKYWNKMLEAKKKADEGEYDMSRYYAKLYSDLLYGKFNFEYNVFNIDKLEGEKIPDDINEYWAIVVDMHN